VGLKGGDDDELVSKINKKVKSITNSPIDAKVGLGKTEYLATDEAAVTAGVDAITANNTDRAKAIDDETQMLNLSKKNGGITGTQNKLNALRSVHENTTK
jgi:Dihydroorotate dehydrogenase